MPTSSSTSTPFGSPKMDGRRAEINFSRLLSCTEELMREDSNSRESPTFTKYLDVLQKKLFELQSNNWIQLGNYSEYLKRVNALSEWKEKSGKISHMELKAQLFESENDSFSNKAPMELSSEKFPSSPTSSREELYESSMQNPISPLSPTTSDFSSSLEKRFESAREELLKKRTSNSLSLSERTARRRRRTELLDESEFDISSAEIIEQNRKIQENITEDMTFLSRTLKENSQHMSNIISKDNKNLDGLDDQVAGNLDRIKKENESLKQHSTSTSSWTLTYWVIMMLVAILFMSTYVFMKVVPKAK